MVTTRRNKSADGLILTKMDEITDTLLYVIKTAKKDLILVSPYVQIQAGKSNRWRKLETAIKKAVERGVGVTFISRMKDAHHKNDIMQTLKSFREIGCSVFLLSNLHAKIYYNEHFTLLTSLNLYLGSTKNNKEIGSTVTDPGKLNTIREYLCEMIGQWEKRSVGGKRVESKEKAPSNLSDVWFKITKVTDKYYNLKLNGKYIGRVERKFIQEKLKAGKEYNARATVKWYRDYKKKNRFYLDGITNVSERS